MQIKYETFFIETFFPLAVLDLGCCEQGVRLGSKFDLIFVSNEIYGKCVQLGTDDDDIT